MSFFTGGEGEPPPPDGVSPEKSFSFLVLVLFRQKHGSLPCT
ncbi:MAG: hypothetical protein NTV51_19710 [Verrucomicrobia bacterium]|nr:hypothetical protein [Verrucomicrobiota bacterium]